MSISGKSQESLPLFLPLEETEMIDRPPNAAMTKARRT
jgi:hypothetical protein